MNADNPLAHPAAGPVSYDDLPVENADSYTGVWQPNWPEGTERRVLGRDPVTGGSTTLLRFPPGYDRPDEIEFARGDGAQRFEYHTSHEEIFSIEGDYIFGEPEIYDFSAPAYLNHPPYWLHPARQRSAGGVMLLVKNNQPVDFLFCQIPSDWEGVEYYADVEGSRPSASEAVTLETLDALDPGAVAENGELLTGVLGQRLWEDREHGWETWVLTAEPGSWFSNGVPTAAGDTAVGDEWFVLEGKVRFVSDSDEEQTLETHGYWCDPLSYPVGGTRPQAVERTRVIRWVRGGHLAAADPSNASDAASTEHSQ